jgi:hypothetical protein
MDVYFQKAFPIVPVPSLKCLRANCLARKVDIPGIERFDLAATNGAEFRSAPSIQPIGLASIWLMLVDANCCGGAPIADGGLAKLEAAYWLNKAICEASVPSVGVELPLAVAVLAA